jgi:ribokinase
MRVAVLGHVEWITFAGVDHVPAAGEIVHATGSWEEPGGGGTVAALQLAKLAGSCDFFTAVGDDELGDRAIEEMRSLGLSVHPAIRAGAATRRAITLIDPAGERTITTLGPRLHADATDPLPWDVLARADAVYVSAGDPEGVRIARGVRVLVVTSRVLDLLIASGVPADALVGSARDPAERAEVERLPVEPGLVVATEGAAGGTYREEGGTSGRFAAVAPPGPLADTYGGGDSFAAGLTWALAAGYARDDALAFAAACGAWAVSGRGVHSGQLTAADAGSLARAGPADRPD